MKSIAHLLTLMLTVFAFVVMPVSNPLPNPEAPTEISSSNYVDSVSDLALADVLEYGYLPGSTEYNYSFISGEAIYTEKDEIRLYATDIKSHSESVLHLNRFIKPDKPLPTTSQWYRSNLSYG